MRKVYVERQDALLCKMFVNNGWEVVKSIFDADLLCVDGGDDVSPEMYFEKNVSSYSNEVRDIVTSGLMYIATEVMSIPVVGICRGSQFMSAFNGGKVKQHIDGHGGSHNLDVVGVTFKVSSTHHQEAIPNVPEYQIYRAEDGVVELTTYDEFNTGSVRMFGMQSHPEYFDVGHPNMNLFFGVLDQLFNSDSWPLLEKIK